MTTRSSAAVAGGRARPESPRGSVGRRRSRETGEATEARHSPARFGDAKTSRLGSLAGSESASERDSGASDSADRGGGTKPDRGSAATGRPRGSAQRLRHTVAAEGNSHGDGGRILGRTG